MARDIAVATLGDFRVTVTATRSAADGDIPTATVHVVAYEKVDGAWIRIARQRVGERGGWFWHPLTGRGGVCTLSTGDTASRWTELSLLLSPSLGCSDVHRFELRDGAFVAR